MVSIARLYACVDEEEGALLNVDLDEALSRYVRERALVVKRLKELSPED